MLQTRSLANARSLLNIAILVYEDANPIRPEIRCDGSAFRDRCDIFQPCLGLDLLHSIGAFLAHG